MDAEKTMLEMEEHEAYLMCRAELLREPVPYEIFETVWHLRERNLLGPFGDGSQDGWFNVNPDR